MQEPTYLFDSIIKHCGPHIEEFLITDKESIKKVIDKKNKKAAEEVKENKKPAAATTFEDLETRVIIK